VGLGSPEIVGKFTDDLPGTEGVQHTAERVAMDTEHHREVALRNAEAKGLALFVLLPELKERPAYPPFRFQ